MCPRFSKSLYYKRRNTSTIRGHRWSKLSVDLYVNYWASWDHKRNQSDSRSWNFDCHKVFPSGSIILHLHSPITQHPVYDRKPSVLRTSGSGHSCAPRWQTDKMSQWAMSLCALGPWSVISGSFYHLVFLNECTVNYGYNEFPGTRNLDSL